MTDDAPVVVSAQPNDTNRVDLVELMNELEILQVDPNYGFIVAAERQLKDPPMPEDFAMRELGSASPSPYTAWTRQEWNPRLRDKLGIQQYYQMPRADGAIRGSLRLMKTPPSAAHWFIEPGSDSPADKKIADFIEYNLFYNLNVPWSLILQDILLMVNYGYMCFEKVFKLDRSGRICLKKLAPRHPIDVREWIYDSNGGPAAVIMEPTDFDDNEPNGILIPISKLVIFTFEGEGGDLRGTSLLRSAYKHYYYKDTLYKIDAIQKERHGIGIPVIKLPPAYTQQDKVTADELGRNLRTNERAHVVLPPGWDLIFAKLEGQPVDAMTSIEHHNRMILNNALAMFMDAPRTDPKSQDMFMKSTRFIADTICDIMNFFVVKQLCDFNYTLGVDRRYPMLRARRIGEWEDIRTASFALRNYVGAGMIRPDDVLEAELRRELDLPQADVATMRLVVPLEPGGAELPLDDPEEVQEATGFNQVPGGKGTDGNTPPASNPGAKAQPPRQGAPTGKAPKNNGGRDNSGGN